MARASFTWFQEFYRREARRYGRWARKSITLALRCHPESRLYSTLLNTVVYETRTAAHYAALSLEEEVQS